MWYPVAVDLEEGGFFSNIASNWEIMDKHDKMVGEFERLGFKSGDTVGIEIDSDEKPNVYRL